MTPFTEKVNAPRLGKSSYNKSGLSAREMVNKAKFAWAGLKFLYAGKPKDFRVNRIKAAEIARPRFAEMLRAPYPGASDAFIAREWAKALKRSPETVQNWLDCKNAMTIDDAFAIATAHGVYETMAILVGEDTRQDLLSEMADV